MKIRETRESKNVEANAVSWDELRVPDSSQALRSWHDVSQRWDRIPKTPGPSGSDWDMTDTQQEKDPQVSLGANVASWLSSPYAAMSLWRETPLLCHHWKQFP